MEKGYCADIPFLTSEQQENALKLHGLKAVDIYVEGRGAETLAACLQSFRGKGGKLHIFGTLRVFGKARATMLVHLKAFKEAGIVLVDHENGRCSTTSGAEMLDDALRKTHGNAKLRESRKFARKIGSEGGKAKLESYRTKRMPEEIAGPLWAIPELPIWRRLELMNVETLFEKKWTEASARRHLDHYRNR